MRFDTAHRAHTSIAGYTVPRVMFQVLAALLPAAVAHVSLFGPGLLLQLAVACPTALLCEAAALRLRGARRRPSCATAACSSRPSCSRCAVPPLLAVVADRGSAPPLAVLLGKHAFGGLGQNPFNPAMVGYAALLVSCPAEMTRWPLPDRRGQSQLERTCDC